MYKKKIRLKINKTIGYQYFYDVEHPLANKNGHVFYHRHVMSLWLKRWLLPNEVVHHVDENKSNNDINNLKLIGSTGEHSRLHYNLGSKQTIEERQCVFCGISFTPWLNYGKFCSRKCAGNYYKKLRISKELLESLVWKMPTVKVADMLGVSDVAIGKRCKLLGISKPPRGYWRKVETNTLNI